MFQWFIKLLRWENVRVTRWKWRSCPFLNFPDVLRQITVILGIMVPCLRSALSSIHCRWITPLADLSRTLFVIRETPSSQGQRWTNTNSHEAVVAFAIDSTSNAELHLSHLHLFWRRAHPFTVGCRVHRQQSSVDLDRWAERHNVAPFKLFQTSVRRHYVARRRFLGAGGVYEVICRQIYRRRLSSDSRSTQVMDWGLLCRDP